MHISAPRALCKWRENNVTIRLSHSCTWQECLANLRRNCLPTSTSASASLSQLSSALAESQASLTENSQLRGCPVFHTTLAADRKYLFAFGYIHIHYWERILYRVETKIRLSCCCCCSAQRKIKHQIILNWNYRICSKNVTKMQQTTKQK